MILGSFTIPLKKVIKLTGGTVTIDPVLGVAVMTGGNIGLNYYQLFDPAYKPRLDGVIIDHFYNREIGMETIDMFQFAMRRKMNEIMPYYNQMYESTKIEFDPLSTMDIHTVSATDTSQTNEGTGTNATTSDSNSKSRAVSSSTPQTMLSGNEDYAENAADSNAETVGTSNATEESSQTSNAESSGDTQITGYQGAASDLIMRYRESLINVDLMIIRDLEELFMLVWDNGDSFTRGYSL